MIAIHGCQQQGCGWSSVAAEHDLSKKMIAFLERHGRSDCWLLLIAEFGSTIESPDSAGQCPAGQKSITYIEECFFGMDQESCVCVNEWANVGMPLKWHVTWPLVTGQSDAPNEAIDELVTQWLGANQRFFLESVKGRVGQWINDEVNESKIQSMNHIF